MLITIGIAVGVIVSVHCMKRLVGIMFINCDNTNKSAIFLYFCKKTITISLFSFTTFCSRRVHNAMGRAPRSRPEGDENEGYTPLDIYSATNNEAHGSSASDVGIPGYIGHVNPAGTPGPPEPGNTQSSDGYLEPLSRPFAESDIMSCDSYAEPYQHSRRRQNEPVGTQGSDGYLEPVGTQSSERELQPPMCTSHADIELRPPRVFEPVSHGIED